jgi:hypothetical protein
MVDTRNVIGGHRDTRRSASQRSTGHARMPSLWATILATISVTCFQISSVGSQGVAKVSRADPLLGIKHWHDQTRGLQRTGRLRVVASRFVFMNLGHVCFAGYCYGTIYPGVDLRSSSHAIDVSRHLYLYHLHHHRL